MALSELVALETAYRALQPLESAARRRGLRWLTDALDVPAPLPEEGEGSPGAPASGDTALASVTDGVAEGRLTVGGEGESVGGRGSPETRTSATRTARRGAGANGLGAKRQRSRSAKASSADGKERVYRRMPPAEEVLRAYAQVGSISGLAEHFGVPRHTVQGWARRLRSAGHTIGRGA